MTDTSMASAPEYGRSPGWGVIITTVTDPQSNILPIELL
jgi:hypothetical protein